MLDIKREKNIFLAVITVMLLTGFSSMNLAFAPSANVLAEEITCPGKFNGVFASQSDVYIIGTALDDGSYYVEVTQTDGTVVGVPDGTVLVAGGNLACTQLTTKVNKVNGGTDGWDETTQNNINYKLKISQDNTFPQGSSLEFDVFKVASSTPPPPEQGSITLVKTLDILYGGNEGENDFGLFIDTNLDVDSGTTIDYDGGTVVAIGEVGFTGYTNLGITGDTDCTDGSVTIIAGENILCYITNRDIQPTITLTKVPVSNYETKDPNDFLLTINGSPATSGTSYPVNSNTQIPIGETQQYGYVLDSVTGDGCPAKEDFTGTPLSASVTLDEGEDLSCTITNKDIRGELKVRKYYDLNANGIHDEPSTAYITGWKVNVDGTVQYTPFLGLFLPVQITVYEYLPIESNWIATTPTTFTPTVITDDRVDVKFGNVCLGPGGGLSKGFWTNKNGEAKINDNGGAASELNTLSVDYNLVNANGTPFNPTTYSQFKAWLGSATATNMSYMLSAQLAAMILNVESGSVSGASLIYAPELIPFATPGLTPAGFISINDLILAANTALGADGFTPSGDLNRPVQEALKNVLDRGDNNIGYVQPAPCPFSFAD